MFVCLLAYPVPSASRAICETTLWSAREVSYVVIILEAAIKQPARTHVRVWKAFEDEVVVVLQCPFINFARFVRNICVIIRRVHEHFITLCSCAPFSHEKLVVCTFQCR